MVTDVYPMVTNGDRCLPDSSRGIQCCQPSKSCKNWWKYQKNAKKWLATLYLPRNYPIPWYYWYSSMSLVVIGVIDWLSGTIGGIGVRPDILPATGSKVSIGYPRTLASDKRGRIESYCHRLRLVTECPRLNGNRNLIFFSDHYFTSVRWLNANSFFIIWTNRLQNLSVISLCQAPNYECQGVSFKLFELLRNYNYLLLNEHSLPNETCICKRKVSTQI